MTNARILPLAAIWLAACAGKANVERREPASGVADTQLGLAKGSVFDTLSPPPVAANGSAPGELPALARPYEGAPPRVPHGIADFLPITQTSNACLECHSAKEKRPGEATPIPASHYTDLRGAPEKAGENVAGARRVCTSCHVQGTSERPLVGNTFGH